MNFAGCDRLKCLMPPYRSSFLDLPVTNTNKYNLPIIEEPDGFLIERNGNFYFILQLPIVQNDNVRLRRQGTERKARVKNEILRYSR